MHTTQVTHQRPAFFETVREKAHTRWNQLEADPELAGPWRLLFAQVQSPRHVLSELLQNADDAGATSASAYIEDGFFIFQHDGEDFDQQQFSSLCRFGFSNKRNLHTIGFRGIGFKSVFSLGDTVEVFTPTLAVRFERRRFSEPVWVDGTSACAGTVIRVRIQDANRLQGLQKNLDEWARSAVSLLFFSHIRELTIAGRVIQRRPLGPGPTDDSEVVEITDDTSRAVYLFRSQEEPFPAEAIEEISAERNLEELNLQPCRVELVLGLPEPQRLYVVLPTEVQPDVPFSCNAPFIQDPARTGLKPAATSPTNRWLLRRLGELAGKAMTDWLGNTAMTRSERARAYELLPDRPITSDTIGDDCSREVCLGFGEASNGVPVLLTTGDEVVESQSCLAPPPALHSVWSTSEILTCFGDGRQHVLAEEVSQSARNVLQKWDWLSVLTATEVLTRLQSDERMPKPRRWDCLVNLWNFVQETVQHDYSGQVRRTVKMLPVEGKDNLFAADEVVRLGASRRLASAEDWDFLSQLIVVVDQDWIAAIDTDTDEQKTNQTNDKADRRVKCAREVLQAIGLGTATSADSILARAATALFAQPNVCVEDVVRLTHIMVALRVRAASNFRYVTKDCQLRGTSENLVWDRYGEVESLVPEDWALSHLLHVDYSGSFTSCDRNAWETWAASEKSGLRLSPHPCEKTTSLWGCSRLEDVLRKRNVTPPLAYPYKRENFTIHDFDFDKALVGHWTTISDSDPSVWSKVLWLLLQDPLCLWDGRMKAIVRQSGNTYSEKVKCDDIPSVWVIRFRGLRCLPDTFGTLREPAELLSRTPYTEPLMHIEPFLRAEYDIPAARPLLTNLGVRDTPSGPEKLLDRIRALATVTAPPIHELAKWYEALDRLLARSEQEDLAKVRNAFGKERLILTEENEWTNVAEAFLVANEEDVPGAPLIHSSVRDLTIWSRLGVAERPTVDLVIGWLKRFQSGKKLDGPDLKRVRTVLPRHPVRIWEECDHWLSLDNVWTSTANLRYRLTMRGLTKFGDLFPTFKARTADLRMLSSDVCDQYPFASLRNLGSEIEYRVSERQCDLPPTIEQPWLRALAHGLARIKLDDPQQTNQVRTVADRLGETRWQSFNTLRVMPYVEGTPAGEPYSPDVFWEDFRLYVRDCSLVRIFDALVTEVARPFGVAMIADVVKACVDRDESFVSEYLDATLDLEPAAQIEPVEEPVAWDEGDNNNVEEGAEDHNAPQGEGESGESETSTPQADDADDQWKPRPGDDSDTATTEEDDDVGQERTAKASAPPLIWRYAKAHGYRWNEGQQRYLHADGNWLQRCSEGTFNWERYTENGDVACRYWVSEQCLVSSGIQVSAELWELIKLYPSESGLILEGRDKQPQELLGTELIEMVASGALQLFPARYRLRFDS